MDAPASVYASKPFLYVVENHIFYLHNELVSNVSPVLDRLMHSEMKEKDQGYAVLQGVDADTFGRFAQWVYNGRYDVPDPIPVTAQPNSESPSMTGLEPKSEQSSTTRNELRSIGAPLSPPPSPTRPCRVQRSTKPARAAPNSSKKRTALLLRQNFKSQGLQILQATTPLMQSVPPHKPSHKPATTSSNRLEILLAHAKIYVFADERDVQPLRLHSLQNIYTELLDFKFNLSDDETACCTIIKLVEFVYDHTHSSEDDLREMMIEYMAMEVGTLSKSAAFRELIMDVGGALLEDFMGAVGKRVDVSV